MVSIPDPEPDASATISELQASAQEDPNERSGELGIIGTARELVLEKSDDGRLVFHIIGFALDPEHMNLVLDQFLATEPSDGDDDAKRILALAMLEEVPVYPNDSEAARELTRLHADLLLDGFEIGGESDRHSYVLNQDVFTTELDGIASGEYTGTPLPPVAALVEEGRSREREEQLANAEAILTNLRLGIAEMEEALSLAVRDEARLHQLLIRFPQLFGLEYVQIISKHQLGKDFVADFALLKHTGVVDMVEIEASNLSLYTKAGNPRKELVHAEQQVLDWLDWLTENAPYAGKTLPGVVSPRGFVVIGSRANLEPGDAGRLRRRNRAWADSIAILTYDDLLDRARAIESALEPPSD